MKLQNRILIRLYFLFALTVALTVALSSKVFAQSQLTLTVRVVGLRNTSGQMLLSLYDSPDGFPSDASRSRQKRTLALGLGAEVQFIIRGLPAGRYAVSLLHDENGNSKMDTNILGIPREGWGCSRNPRPAFRAPRFNEAVVELKQSQTLTVSLAY